MASWDWQLYCTDMVTEEVAPKCFGAPGYETYLDAMIHGWGWTMFVSVVGLLVALVAGALIGVLRTVPNRKLAMFGESWTELFRNIPLIVQLFIWYHVVPRLFPVLDLPPSVLVVIAIGLFTSARISEQVKAGILTLPKGQRYAGQALGLTLPQTYRHVLLPMAFRIVIPPLTSESMNIVKNSAVAFAVSIPELAQFAQQASEETSHFEEIYIPVTALYFISAFAINRIAKFIEARVRIPGQSGGK